MPKRNIKHRCIALAKSTGNRCPRPVQTGQDVCGAHLKWGYETTPFGRPPVMNGNNKREAVELARSGLGQFKIAEILGISESSLKKHLREDPEFREAWNNARESRTDDVETVLYDLATKNQHFQAVQTWLKAYRSETYDPDRYSRGSVNAQNINVYQLGPPEGQRERIAEILSSLSPKALQALNGPPDIEGEVVDDPEA